MEFRKFSLEPVGNSKNREFEQELTCQFKIHMRNLINFDTSTRKSQKFAL